MCGVSDPDDVLAASARCDELGLDTISAGGTIAWAMECAERGLLDAPWLRFGDGGALLRWWAVDPRSSLRTSRVWKCPGMSLAPCRAWRWAWRSTPAAPTTTAP